VCPLISMHMVLVSALNMKVTPSFSFAKKSK
jgi:hypothetical protein